MNCSLFPILGMCLLTLVIVTSCDREPQRNQIADFWGVNLDENGNQVEKLHNLLLAGEVRLNGNVLKEWADHLGTDYSLSEGNMVSVEIEHGDVEHVSYLRDSLNLSYSERFISLNHLKLKQWVLKESDDNYFEYLDLYQYGDYSIGVTYRIYSPTCDETNITSAEVRVGLGFSK